MKKEKVLIIAAHPDDDILGCGGYCAKYSNTKDIRVIFIAEGSSCRFQNIEDEKEEINKAISVRTDCSRKALSVLGINNVSFYDMPCGRLDSVSIIDINKIIEKEVIDFQADTLITHSELDVNNDHRIVNRSVMMATRPVLAVGLKNIFTFEVLSSSEWNLSDPFTPNLFEELSEDNLNKKWEALSCFKGEIRDYPHPRSKIGMKTLASYRGMQIGVSYAEGFKIVRSIVL